MKLAIVRQKYTPYGGAERFVERALAALGEQGVDVSVIARQWTGDVKGVTCDPFYLGRTWRDASFARCVQSIISSGRFDLVQSHERIPGCHVYRAGDGVHRTWLELRGKRLADLAPWHRYTLAAEEAMFRHPELRAVICNSRMVRDDIAWRFGIPVDRLHVIYNGLDLDRFSPVLAAEHRNSVRSSREISATVPVVLFVGSGFERKGLPTLLEAMSQIDAELWVVGRDKHEGQMRSLAARFGIAGRVRFFGPQQDVRPFYGAADVFALPTIYDPLPNAALEALACGLPVVTTRTCGAAELIDGESGAVVDSGNPAQLADALQRIFKDLGTRRVHARDSVKALTLDAMGSRLRDVYAMLLGKPG